MNVASIDLCRELYELSGWDDTDRLCCLTCNEIVADEQKIDDGRTHESIPAYDLGYLLRKLPKFGKYTRGDGLVAKDKTRLTITVADSGTWVATMDSDYEEDGWIDPSYADTPEDAAAKLAIELFKQGILTENGGKKG